MRLQCAGEDMRITFEGDDRLDEAWGVCVQDQYGYPSELHDLRPYGIDVKDKYISVGLCNDKEVLWRIKALMRRFERDFGMKQDKEAQERMSGWSEPVRAFCGAEKQTSAIAKNVAGIPERCTRCKYRYMKNGTDCKLYLLMGEAACR